MISRLVFVEFLSLAISLHVNIRARSILIFSPSENEEYENVKISGISDLELGIKIKVLKKENINNEISFLTTLIIPSASNDLSINSFGISNRMIFSHTLSDKTGLGYNLGYDYFGSGRGNLTYTLAVGTSLTEKLGFFMEPFGEIVDLNNLIHLFVLKSNSNV